MTRSLEQAIAKLQELPAVEQDAIAELILKEIADEQRWDQSFAKSQDKLGQMAEKVREDIRNGRVKDAEIDDL